MSGVIGANRVDVENALKQYAVARGGRFEPTEAKPPSSDSLILCESEGNTTVVYPGVFGSFADNEAAASHMSRSLNAPVFFFHVHDGDLWMYILFVVGEAADQFYSMADYFGYSSDDERKRWSGNAASICRACPRIEEHAIRNYLIQWDLLDKATRKAYKDEECPYEDDAYAHEDDEHPFGDCMQVVDFMRKLGLRYPLDDEGEVLGETYSYLFELPKPKPEKSDGRVQTGRWLHRFVVKRWMILIAVVAAWALTLVYNWFQGSLPRR
jgi:hypothetical protein